MPESHPFLCYSPDIQKPAEDEFRLYKKAPEPKKETQSENCRYVKVGQFLLWFLSLFFEAPKILRFRSSQNVVETANQATVAATIVIMALSRGSSRQQIIANAMSPQDPRAAPAASIFAEIRPRCVPSEPTAAFFSFS